MPIKYVHQHRRLQDPPKFTQITIFGLKNKPSGNPAIDFDTTNSSLRAFNYIQAALMRVINENN
jgi:hypothetical protein